MNAGGEEQAARAAREMLGVSEKLAAGAKALAALPRDPEQCATPRDEVYRIDGVRLYRYRGSEPVRTQPPILIVYALVNRPYILDLEPDRSFVRGLLEHGRDVYLVDWGSPGEEGAGLGLDDYVNRYLHGCVRWVQTQHGVQALDLVGVCQGGTLSLCYAALEPARVRALALMVTPVDFHAEGFLLSSWLRHVDVDRLVDTLGNVPGPMLNWAFLALKPLSLAGLKALDLIGLMDDPEALATFVRMERWLQDNPDLAGRAFREFTQSFFRGNALVAGGLAIGGREVSLERICQPVLNVFATRDHIVPPAASRPLTGLLAHHAWRELEFDGGHIGVFTSRRARRTVPGAVCRWLAEAGDAP